MMVSADVARDRLPPILEAVAEDPEQAARRDLYLAPALERWGTALAPSHVLQAARMRVRHGPLLDALSCLPSAGDGWLEDPDEATVHARVELMIWEAGGRAATIPRLGSWLAKSSDRWTRWLGLGARAGLLPKVGAARLLEVCADGLFDIPMLRRDQARRQVTALAEHPEPLVWIPAARTLGRLAGRDVEAQDTLTQWIDAEGPSPRRRALTALCCVPVESAWWPEARVRAALDDPRDPWAVAALGPALPYLVCERRELWLELAARLEAGEPGPEVLWSVVQGLLSLALRDALDRPGRAILRGARDRALAARPRATTQAQLWLEIQRRTDFLDDLDPDPDDLELQMRRAVKVATELGPEPVADRMKSLAARLEPAFTQALLRAESPGDPRAHAVALANLESCARAAALGLWRPVLRAAGRGPEAASFEDLPERLLARLEAKLAGASPDYPRHRAALRALGLLLDARAAGAPAAAARLLAEVPLADNKARGRFRKPVGDVLLRLVEGAAPPELPPRVRFGRFAAYFALTAPRIEGLELLPEDHALVRAGREVEALTWVEDLRGGIRRGHQPADGAWTGRALDALDALHARETPLAEALEQLGEALREAADARRSRDDDRRRVALEALAAASARWAAVLAAPEGALDEAAPPPTVEPWPSLQDALQIVDDPREAPRAARDVAADWARGHGPVLDGPVARAVERLLTVRGGSSFSRLPTRRVIAGYKLLEPLGSGAQGEVWLVERTRVGRRFVMKLLPPGSSRGPDAASLQAALEAEARLLGRIYHPNVGRFVDSGRDGQHPFLVLEYLIGCDLERYAKASLLTVSELKPIVADICAGLEALGSYGLVHCDLKPQNVFLQLALPPDRPRFEADRDRDPELSPMLGAVVIDFGIARSMASVGAADPSEMSGTLGFLAPEQIRGQLHPKTDVYALAATVFRALTGGTFFEDRAGVAAKLLAHGETAPFDEEATRAALAPRGPAALVALLEEATRLDPEARPDVRAFAERFEAL